MGAFSFKTGQSLRFLQIGFFNGAKANSDNVGFVDLGLQLFRIRELVRIWPN